MLKITVKKGNIERALKEYKGKIIRTKQLRLLNERKEYEKPSEKNRKRLKKGRYKQQKRMEEDY
jgi:small subunit ribosomal protein S21